MSKLNFSSNKLGKFLSSKGFYVAIAVCLVGAGAATWLAVDRTITGIENSNNQVIQDNFTDFPPLEEVEKKQEDVAKDEDAGAEAAETEAEAESQPSTQPSSSSNAASSSEPESESTEASAASEESSEPPAPLNLSYSLPVRGSIVNPFSGGELVKNVTMKDWRTHDGIDITADLGTDVCAAADGTVVSVAADTLWGTIVTIDHPDGRQSIYSGLNPAVAVQEGEAVLARQVLGTLDAIPCEIDDDPHLHFAMKQDGSWIDPMTVIANSEG